MFEAILVVLEPEVRKLKEFLDYHRVALGKFTQYVSMYANTKEKRRPSDSMVWNLCRMVDMLALLDVLKNMKASMTNDFTFFKRQKTKSQRSDGVDIKELGDLGVFLAGQDSIMLSLQAELAKTMDQDTKKKDADPLQDLLVQFANQASDWVDTEHYTTPKEKYMLLRCIPYFLYLGDEAARPVNRVKTVRVSQYTRLFKKYPVVPLYGDMQTQLANILRRAPSFRDDSALDSSVSESKSVVEYMVIHHLATLRQSYNTFLALWNSTMKEVKLQLKANGAPLGTVSETLALEVRRVILQGFSLLSDWSGRVLSQAAWKYSHMNQDPKIKATVDYERAVRYNYDSNEKFALIELIAMLKSLANLMLREDAMLGPIIRSSIHDEIQQFVQIEMRDMLRHTAKNKDKFRQAFSELTELRLMAADWKDGVEPSDPAMRGEKASASDPVPMIPKRSVPPSPTQLSLFRAQVFGLLTEPRKKLGMFGDKDLSDAHVKSLEVIYERSFWYPALINFANTIRDITDLGDLWYREYFLELTKRIQFEIDMSLAWSLCDHVLESNNLSMMDSILYPLDIYNDAANRALKSLRQQFLYDEIEAEVNLAFDQLIYKLSDQCYAHYKTVASCMVFDKDLKAQLEVLYPERAPRFQPPKSRLSTLFSQRHFQLLGRSVDLNDLLSQRMNTSLRSNMNAVIAKFEASPITGIIEFEQLLNIIRTTHALLVQDGLSLDPWDSIYNESNASSSIRSFHGRVVLHIVFEFVYDLWPNFVYTSATNRFIRAPPLGRQEEIVLRENMPKLNPKQLYGNKVMSVAYQQHWELFTGFFGMPHVDSIYRCIGKEAMPLVIGELLSNMSLKLNGVLEPYVGELGRGLPADKTNLPKYAYGVTGSFEYFRAKLIDLQNYPVLVTEVFHQFREWGNAVVVLTMLDAGASGIDTSMYMLSAPFLGVTPSGEGKASKSSSKKDSAAAAAATAGTNGGATNGHHSNTTRPPYSEPSPLVSTIKSINAILEKKPEIAKSTQALSVLLSATAEAERLYQLPATRHTLLKAGLEGIADMIAPLAKGFGITAGPVDNQLLPIDQTYEFYRIWSAMLFCFLIDVPDNERHMFNKSSFELFGEGFLWAGTVIVHFLGQRARFEAFDFGHHLARMAEAIGYDERSSLPSSTPGGAPTVNWTALFLQQRFPEARDIIKRVFHLLHTNFPVDFKPASHALSPPATDAAINAKFVAPAQV